jgi:hypothetical protein
MAKPDYRSISAPKSGRITINLPVAGSLTFRQMSGPEQCLSFDLAREKMAEFGPNAEFPLIAQNEDGQPMQIHVGETFAKANAALALSVVPSSPEDNWQWEDFAIASVATPEEWEQMNEALTMVNAVPKAKKGQATE